MIFDWQFHAHHTRIHDSNNHDTAEKVLDNIISYSKELCDVNKHFFRVEMIGINNENEKLLNYIYILESQKNDWNITIYNVNNCLYCCYKIHKKQ